MIKILFQSALMSLLICSCNGFRDKQNLAHLNSKEFIAANPAARPLDGYHLYERMQHFNVPGLSIAVVDSGEIVWAEGYGKADIETNKKVDPNTLFQAASVSKPIAALGILKLAEQKRVNLDEDVNSYLKNYQLPENNFTKEQKVTLRAILAHTAGLNVEGFVGYPSGEKLPGTLAVLSGKGNSDRLEVVAEPGRRWHYSGGGYTLMQMVVEDVTNRPFHEFMKVEILDPLGMTNSTFEQPLPEKYHANVSSAFDANGKLLDGKWHNYPEKAAAGLWTTPSDLANYCIAIQEIWAGKTSQGILSKASVEMMFENKYHSNQYISNTANIPSDYTSYWGLGLEVAINGKSVRFQHAGFNEGFKANFTAFANEGKAIVLMANADNGYDLMMEVEKVISDYYRMGIW